VGRHCQVGGVPDGRSARSKDTDAAKARALKAKDVPAPDIAKLIGCSRATVYRYLAESPSK
jgi:DNA invertase Pin-like site-specific DNA recombinase